MTTNPDEALKNALANGVAISYSVKYLPCNNPECMTCLMGKGHGPYWYAQYELEGEAKNVFLGREFRPLDMAKVILNNYQQSKQTAASESAKAKATNAQATNEPATPMEDPKVDRIGKVSLGKFEDPKTKETVTSMPSRRDFERDLLLLKGAVRSQNLKAVYRKLIKKYHPDQFQGNPVMNRWMTEINGQYNRLQA